MSQRLVRLGVSHVFGGFLIYICNYLKIKELFRVPIKHEEKKYQRTRLFCSLRLVMGRVRGVVSRATGRKAF